MKIKLFTVEELKLISAINEAVNKRIKLVMAADTKRVALSKATENLTKAQSSAKEIEIQLAKLRIKLKKSLNSSQDEVEEPKDIVAVPEYWDRLE